MFKSLLALLRFSALKRLFLLPIILMLLLGLYLILSQGIKPDSKQLRPAPPAAVKQDLSQQQLFRTFLDKNYVQDMQRFPFTASYRGIDTDPNSWDAFSEFFFIKSRKINEQRLLNMQKFDRQALSESLQKSYDLYRIDLERLIAMDDFRHHHFIIHQHKGPHTLAVGYLIAVHNINDVASAQSYIGRLKNIAVWFNQVIEQLKIREQKGMMLAHWQYEKIVLSSKNVISGAPFDEGEASSLWADFNRKLDALALDEVVQQALKEQAMEALINDVKPAYERLIAILEQQATIASNDDGVWKFPDGEAFYQERLNWFTTTDLSADQIHQLGLKEVARIHLQMRAIMKKVGFEGELIDFFMHMRDSEEFYYPATQAGRSAYLNDAVAVIDAMHERLPEVFGVFPKAQLSVRPVEAFREKTAGKAFYESPTADGSRPGIYYANLYDMASMPKYQLEALAYHEGIPGHHMQRAIAVELEAVPEFQKWASFTAYTEGWGLYSEYLPKELGFYQDPYSDFGRLALELWRACRLVVDTGIHAKRWTRDEAIDYLLTQTPNSVGDVTKSVERYIAQPGQSTAYMIGKLKIVELREKAKSQLGDLFDIRRFHDVILKDGPLPLFMLEQNIQSMISEVKTEAQGAVIEVEEGI